ncbi:MAG: FAD-dependent oxidoreductase [Bacteroidetes bacterium]|nr:MAG: FAD-dependent oxidoreductase [Bacteroidota bacterium]
MKKNEEKYDALIVGGGIAGQEAALSLANMNRKVLLVEKDLSIGGKMIQLSKVFPTLDCAACITTPKMSETARHGNITLMLNSDIKRIERNEKGFHIEVTKNPRYVKAEACTGCQQCEQACPEVRNDQYNRNLVGRKVAYIPFTLANPRIAVIDRENESAPCTAACPGGVKSYGYVSLVRNGQYEDAMRLHLEDAPIPGSLGRACFAPCQGECTRGSVDGPVDSRRIKRFFTEVYYEKHPEPPAAEKQPPTGKSVAVVGSGPAGLAAAYFLALKGHRVKIFEAAPEAGGMLKLTLPEYRLPKQVVDRDIKNITSLGVEIECNYRVTSLKKLKEDGFDAVFVSVGTHDSVKLGVEGSDHPGVISGLDFLLQANIGKRAGLTGKKVVVVGGGNSAIDVARTAVRLKADDVTIICLEQKGEMPAYSWEVEEAEEEGVRIIPGQGIRRIISSGKSTCVVELKKCLRVFDDQGKFAPVYEESATDEIRGSNCTEPVDLVIEAIGMRPSTSSFAAELTLRKNGTIEASQDTLQTSTGWIFAGGDSVTGPTTIIEAVGQGKRAAFYLDKYLLGEELSQFSFGDKLEPVDKKKLLAHKKIEPRKPITDKYRKPEERIRDFRDVELTYTEEEALVSASRCLDCSNCRECHQCVSACPANAIDFSQKKEEVPVYASSIILSSGFRLFSAGQKPQYGFGRYPNVVDALQMDRLIAPTRPFNNVLRPGDGKVPDNIAYVLCTGSRDSSLENFPSCGAECSNNPICSQICCMYSIKQAQLLMGALPLADITIYYMDIRSFGKGYDEFFRQSADMGINFIKGKVATIREKDNRSGDLIVRIEDIESGRVKEFSHDLVVLSSGIRPENDILRTFRGEVPELDEFRFIRQADLLMSPARTTVDGVFVAGTAAAPMDIPDSILSAGCAASEVAAYLKSMEQTPELVEKTIHIEEYSR